MHDETPTIEDFWLSMGARPYGLSAKQVAYAKARLGGCNRTEAVRTAGYKVNGNASASTLGSNLEKDPNIQRLILAAQEHAKMIAGHDVADVDELLKILTYQSRYSRGTEKQKAIELLLKYKSGTFGDVPIAPPSVDARERLMAMAAKADLTPDEQQPNVLFYAVGKP